MFGRNRHPLPERTYEPNIIHNPFTWMGVHTPHGWRVHRKRWGQARRLTISLSGDGQTTFFPEALLDPETGHVEWQDDLHLRDDPFTDGGIYPCDPRVEYPVGRPRWAISHTLLCYTVADHGLYTHEYTWDLTHGHLQTHFRHPVELEEARTDAVDGRTVQVRQTPISRTVEGNVHYPMPNSAVRGVWADPERRSANLYARRVVQLISMHNGVYAIAPRVPVVQCRGLYHVLPDDPLSELFDPENGECRDHSRLIEQCCIPLDEPKLGLIRPTYRNVPSRVYEGQIGQLAVDAAVIDAAQLDRARQRLGEVCAIGGVGYARDLAVDQDSKGYDGYHPSFDLNENGVIDEEDLERLARHAGRSVRINSYFDAYFGGDWLTTSVCFDSEHQPGAPAIADYECGGGYDAETGGIRLLETPGPDQPVWIDYHYDAPAEPGENNVRVHLYRESE